MNGQYIWIVLGNDTIWWMLLATYKYMNIWLGGAWLICVKQVLSYHFLKTKANSGTTWFGWPTLVDTGRSYRTGPAGRYTLTSSKPQLLHMDNLVWVTYPYRHRHIEMARDLLADRHLHQLSYSQFTPQVLIEEIGMRRSLNSFKIMSLKIVRNRGHD
jgi:hypothetical protein